METAEYAFSYYLSNEVVYFVYLRKKNKLYKLDVVNIHIYITYIFSKLMLLQYTVNAEVNTLNH